MLSRLNRRLDRWIERRARRARDEHLREPNPAARYGLKGHEAEMFNAYFKDWPK